MFRTLIQILFDLEPDETISAMGLSLRHGWGVATLLLVAMIVFGIYLYRSETGLSLRRRRVMATCYVLAGSLLVLMLAEPVMRLESTQPVRRTLLVLLDTSQSMSIRDDRRDASDAAEAAKLLEKLPIDRTPDRSVTKGEGVRPDAASRLDLAKAAITHPEIDLAGTLGKEYLVRFFSFGDRLEPIRGEGESIDWLDRRSAEGRTSQIGSAIEEAVARHAGQRIAGVVVLSDFAWVKGRDPVEVAARMRDRGLPIYTVGVGLPAPPDIHLRKLIAPEVVFTGDKVPVLVQIDSHGFDERSVELVLRVDGKAADRREVTLTGGAQFAELLFLPKRTSGSAELHVEIETLPGETSTANNTDRHKATIIEEKINVLYVEGMPRWEYRYLRWVLLRDHRLNVKFLMTQGDKQLAATSRRHLARFPVESEEVLKYDLVILGDVSSSYFSDEQLSLIQRLVKEGGGSLLMLAGPTGAPATYVDTDVADMLPVKIGGQPWTRVDAATHPVITSDGIESSVVALADSKQQNNHIWSAVRPMGYLPTLHGARRGATVLLSIPRSETDTEDYPLVAWQRYGTGKTMFVGTADLWRLRREVGDKHHARFWGQAIQFLSLSRLLGKNKQISVETSRAQYAAGEYVDVFANVLTESFEPVEQPSYVVLLEKEAAGALPVELELSPQPDTPGLYRGTYLAGEEGSHLVRSRDADASIAGTARFEVHNVPLELRETAMRRDLAEQIAAISGGRRFAATELASLSEFLTTDQEYSTTIYKEKDLWDMPATFLLLVLVSGVEWYLRRRENLV